MRLSVVIIVKNEERSIDRVIKDLWWADEVIVIDDNSKDKTKNLAESAGATVFLHTLSGNFAKQRNFGLSKAKGEWVLFMDADERISEPLREEILSTIEKENDTFGYFIKREDILWGKKMRYGDLRNVKLLRLTKKNAGKWEGKVHEKWSIKGNTGVLKHAFVHYPHQTIAEFLKELNYYSSIRAQELYEQKVRSSFVSILFYAEAKFFLNYFVKLGFLDGTAGMVHAILMSFYSFLVRAKLWKLRNHKNE